MFSRSSRNKTLAIAVKKYKKADIKVFYSGPVLPDFFTLFKNVLSRIVGDGPYRRCVIII